METKKLTRRLNIHYTLIQMAFWMSFVCIINFAAVILQYDGFESSQVGTIIMLAAILSTFMQSWLGDASDRYQAMTPRRIMVCMALFAIAVASLLAFVNLPLLIRAILYVLVITDIYSIQPFITSMCFGYINRGIPMNFGVARGIGSVASAASSFTLGKLMTRFNPRVTMPFFIGYYVLLMIFGFFFRLKPEEEAAYPDRVHSAKAKGERGSFLEFFRKYRLFCFFLVGMIVLKAGNQIIFTYLNRIVERVGGDNAALGRAAAIASLSELPAMALSKRLIQRFGSSALLKISAFFFLVKAVLLAFSTSMGMVYFGQAFQMLSFALLIPVSTYYCNEVVEVKDQVTGQALTAVALNCISSAIGNFFGGMLLQYTGLKTTLLVALVLVVLGMLLFFITAKRPEAMQAKIS